MTRTVRGVVFDLDGTLVDSRADIAAAANFSLAQHGLTTLSEETISRFVGDGSNHLMARAAGIPVDALALAPLLATFLEYYTAHACIRTRLMPGAIEALDELRDLPLAILTNKSRGVTDALLEALGLHRRFACVIAGGDLPVIKPEPLALQLIARQIGTLPSSLVMVGDGPQDVECGRRAGAYTVGVAGGIAPPDQLLAARPDRMIRTLYELDTAISTLSPKPTPH